MKQEKEKSEFEHNIVIQPDNIYYLLRNGGTMICQNNKLPYNINDQEGKTFLMHSWCSSSCPSFDIIETKEGNKQVSISCGSCLKTFDIKEMIDNRPKKEPNPNVN